MVKRYSFRIDDAEGMNKVLATGNFVANGGVAVGEGWINFCVEDGAPDNVTMQILDHKIALGKDLLLLEQAEFDATVIEYDRNELEVHRSQKEVVENKKEWEAAAKKMEQIGATDLLKQAELHRLRKLIKLRQARIDELQSSVA